MMTLFMSTRSRIFLVRGIALTIALAITGWSWWYCLAVAGGITELNIMTDIGIVPRLAAGGAMFSGMAMIGLACYAAFLALDKIDQWMWNAPLQNYERKDYHPGVMD